MKSLQLQNSPLIVSPIDLQHLYDCLSPIAAAQLVIFLVFLISIYSICYVSCCLACAATEDGGKGGLSILCTCYTNICLSLMEFIVMVTIQSC